MVINDMKRAAQTKSDKIGHISAQSLYVRELNKQKYKSKRAPF